MWNFYWNTYIKGNGFKIIRMLYRSLYVTGDAEMGNRLNRVVRGCLEANINPVECEYSLL